MRNIALAVLSLLLVSCSESKMLQSSLMKFNSSIAYLHDSPASNYPRNKQVSIILNNTPLDTVTSVSKISTLVLPFIIFDYYDAKMKVKLGQSSIQEDYNTFFTGSLTEESKRSGCFDVTDQQTADSVYTLALTIDTCNTLSQYRKNFLFMYLFIAYSYSYSESGSPAETTLQVTAKFSKGSSLVYEKKYNIKRTQPFINPSRWNSNKLRADFTTNMVEGLSLSTKECIEQIVADVNTSLYGTARPIMQVEEVPVTPLPPVCNEGVRIEGL